MNLRVLFEWIALALATAFGLWGTNILIRNLYMSKGTDAQYLKAIALFVAAIAWLMAADVVPSFFR